MRLYGKSKKPSWPLLLSGPETRHRVQYSEDVQKPQHHHDYGHSIQMLLIALCMGMQVFTSQRGTPMTISAISLWINGIVRLLSTTV